MVLQEIGDLLLVSVDSSFPSGPALLLFRACGTMLVIIIGHKCAAPTTTMEFNSCHFCPDGARGCAGNNSPTASIAQQASVHSPAAWRLHSSFRIFHLPNGGHH